MTLNHRTRILLVLSLIFMGTAMLFSLPSPDPQKASDDIAGTAAAHMPLSPDVPVKSR